MSLTPQEAEELIAAHGWTFIDLCALVHVFARRMARDSSMKWSGGRVMVWIKRERQR